MPRNPLIDEAQVDVGHWPLNMSYSPLNSFICQSQATGRRPYVNKYPTKRPASRRVLPNPAGRLVTPAIKSMPRTPIRGGSRGKGGVSCPSNDDHRGQSQSRSARACRQPTTFRQGPPSLSGRLSPCHATRPRKATRPISPMSREITFCVIIGEQMCQATPGASPYRNARRLPD